MASVGPLACQLTLLVVTESTGLTPRKATSSLFCLQEMGVKLPSTLVRSKKDSHHPSIFFKSSIYFFSYISLILLPLFQMWEILSVFLCSRTMFIGALRRKVRFTDRTSSARGSKPSCWLLDRGWPRFLCTSSRDTTPLTVSCALTCIFPLTHTVLH